MLLQRTVVILLVLTVQLSSVVQAQFETTLAGGPWNQPTTWKDNAIPGPNDNVIIKGPVTIDIITQVGEITIDARGSVRPEVITPTTTYKLYVQRHITNEGTLKGPNLDVYVGGNVYNAGSWQTHAILLQDTTQHYFTSFPGTPLRTLFVRADSAMIRTAGPVAFDSTMVYVDEFYLGNNNPVMPNDTLYLKRNTIFRVNRFIGNGNAIILEGGSFLSTSLTPQWPVYENVHLMGEVFIGSNHIYVGDIVLSGTMRPKFLSFSPTIKVQGNFTNQGELAPGLNNYGLRFEVSGNFINKGPCEVYLIRFTGTGTHFLSTDLNYRFAPEFMEALTSTVKSQSSLRFDKSNVKFNRLELGTGHTLFLNQETFFRVNELIGSGNVVQMISKSVLDGAINNNPIATYRDIELKGEVNIGANIQIVGDTRLSGVMKPFYYSTSPTLAVYGSFENTGDILPGPNNYELKMIIQGDIINRGVWDSYTLTIPGKGPYTLVTDSSGRFSPATLTADSATIQSGSDLRFDGCRVEIDRLEMKAGHSLHVANSSILKVNQLIGRATDVYLTGQSYIGRGRKTPSPEYHSVHLRGDINIGSNVQWYGRTQLFGTMKPYFYSTSPTMTFYGPFINLGSIEAGPNGYLLKFVAHDSIINRGRWDTLLLQWVGQGPFSLETDTTQVFMPRNLSADSATVISASPLRLDTLQAFIQKLVLQPGHSLFLNGGFLRTDELVGNGNTLVLAPKTYLGASVSRKTTAIYRDVILRGSVGIGGNIQLAGRVYLYGTMAPHFYSTTPDVSVLDFFQNAGSILLGPNGFGIDLLIYGDFENLGPCKTSSIGIVGQRDQHIGIKDSTAALQQVQIDAQINGNRFQWMKDGTQLSNDGNFSGTRLRVLSIKTLSPKMAGVYQCRVDSAGTVRMSRKIIINRQVTAVEPPPQGPREDGLPPGGSPGQGLPRAFALWQNYPNPFNPTTTIRFDLPMPAHVTIQVFDVSGRLVQTLIEGNMQAGRHRVNFSAEKLPSGLYIYRMQARSLVPGAGAVFSASQKMMLLK